MDFQSVNYSIAVLFKTVWWIVTNFPGVIVPFIIAGILASIFHWKDDVRDLAESIIGLFF